MAGDTVYLNGEFLPAEKARVSVLDRGFLFGDGIYEVIPVYGGRLFRLQPHLDRLDHSLDGIRLTNPLPHAQWQAMLEKLVTENGGGELSVYLQVTRGVARRDHAFPAEAEPTVFAMCNPLVPVSDAILREGIRTVTVEDIRWHRCDIKAIALLPNVLMRQQAVESGAAEAILVRQGTVTEGAASNLFIVRNGIVHTPPKNNLLLPGITRDLVVELCRANGIECVEEPSPQEALFQADEVWVTSSTKEVVPVISVDGQPVGHGTPGPMWQRVIDLYRDYKDRFRRGEVN